MLHLEKELQGRNYHVRYDEVQLLPGCRYAVSGDFIKTAIMRHVVKAVLVTDQLSFFVPHAFFRLTVDRSP